MRSYIYYSFIIVFTISSCSKDYDNNDITDNQPPIADFNYYDLIDNFKLVNTSTDFESDSLSLIWSISSNLIELTSDISNITYFEVPELSNPETVNITLTVDDGNNQTVVTKNLQLPQMSNSRKWGLGVKLQEELSNNATYNWYIDQMNTGIHSGNNCGPSAVTMAIKWANESFTKTAEDARKTFRPEGGWWYTSDIIKYLDMYSTANKTVGLTNIELLKDEIDNGNIAIICLDMYYISNETKSEWRINKFYTTSGTGWGHFILLKGYKIIDNQLLFEFYDPYSMGKKYSDNTLKGVNRYYTSSDIDNSTNIWWDFAIIVSKNTFKSAEGLDINKIPHQFGR